MSETYEDFIMNSYLIVPAIIFTILFLTTGITSLIAMLDARKKLRTLYTESMAYIHAEFDHNMFRLLVVTSVIGILVSLFPFLPLIWRQA